MRYGLDCVKKSFKILILAIIIVGVTGLFKSTLLSIDPPITDVVNDAEEQHSVQEISFWGLSSEDNQNEEILQQLVAKYNAQSDTVKVNLEMKSDRYFYKIFSNAIATQNNPDVSMLFCSQAAQYWDKGFLFSLDSTIGEISEKEQYFPRMLEQTRMYEQCFGIPMSFESFVLLINKQIFDKNNIKVPENLDEFLDAMRRISSGGTAGVALPNKGYLSSRTLTYFLLVNGGSLFEPTGDINLLNKKNSEVYDFLNTLFDEGLVYNEKSQLGIQDVTNLFSSGEVAAVLTSPTKLRGIFEDTDKSFIQDVEILTLRGFDDIMHSSGPIFLDVVCVFKNSQHKGKAQDFAAWLCEEYARQWEQGNGGKMPAIVVQNDSAMLNERLTQKYYGEILNNGSYPTYPKENSVNYIILEGTNLINNFLADIALDIELEEVVIKYQEQLDEWVKRFNRYKV